MKCLNLGCGGRFHPAWTNIDVVPTDPSVLGHDLRKGIPLPDHEFDVVYQSHILEHFPKAEGRRFLGECFRVLKLGGTLRVAVPDLERIARSYLSALEQAAAGGEQARHDHEWMVIELYDQTARETSGGEMSEYLFRDGLANRDFVIGRIGLEAKQAIEYAEQTRHQPRSTTAQTAARSSIIGRLRHILREPATRREALASRLLGAEYELLKLGRFRRGGEIHMWMYDRYSLAQALKAAGFRDTRVVGALESCVRNWVNYNLDTDPDGTIYRPDSLFMEASK